jgi:hypothetical protein
MNAKLKLIRFDFHVSIELCKEKKYRNRVMMLRIYPK